MALGLNKFSLMETPMEPQEPDQKQDKTPWEGDYRELTIDDFADEVVTTKPSPLLNLQSRHSLTVVLQGSLVIILVTLYNWLSNNTYGLAVSFPTVIEGHQYWRLWTSLLIHSDFSHIASNLWLFGVFGYLLHAGD